MIVTLLLIAMLSGFSGYRVSAKSEVFTVTVSPQPTSVAGHVSVNTTWTLAQSPYIVTEDVIVDAGVVLAIAPGVTIKFTNGTSLVVDGSLIAQGNLTHVITFTSSAAVPMVGDWGTIRIRNRGNGNISYATVEYASAGMMLESAEQSVIERTNVTENSRGISLLPYSGMLEVINCTISENLGDGLHMDDHTSAYVCDTEIANNKGGGIVRDIAAGDTSRTNIAIDRSVISNNSGTGVWGEFIDIRNSVITNNALGVSGRSVKVSSSHITHNVYEGVYAQPLGIIVLSSEISYNGRNGIESMIQLPPQGIGAAEIHYNDIYGNADDLSNDAEGEGIAYVNATFNWWGTANKTQIQEHVSGIGPENYVPFLNSSAMTGCSLSINPTFHDSAGRAVYPSSWSVEFPNSTVRMVSSPVVYNQAQMGDYSIVSIIWNGLEVAPDRKPTASLISDMVWSPSIDCVLPTSLTVSLSSSTSYVGFRVQINGSVTYNGGALAAIPILISYSVTGGESWNDITLVNTTSDGSYSAVWIPPATGNYIVKSVWSGDSAFPEATTTVNLAVMPFKEENVFSVTSNSTVSELAFNSTSRELSFTVAGPPGTEGYVDVYIAKTLVGNIADVKIYIDSNQLNYTATSPDDSWHLHFTYAHSVHTIAISLGSTPPPPPQLLIALSVGILASALIIAVAILILRKRRGHSQKS